MGRTHRTRSWQVNCKPALAACTRSSTALWVNKTPLAVPVVPEVNRIKAPPAIQEAALGKVDSGSRVKPIDEPPNNVKEWLRAWETWGELPSSKRAVKPTSRRI